MKVKAAMSGVCLLLFTTVALAQNAPQPPGRDPVAENLFAPELILGNQDAIGLTAEQKGAIRDELRKAQSRFTELQWQLQDAMEILVSQLKDNSVDENRALGQLEKVLSIEREIKRAQLSLMIHLKNRLTPEQQARLRELRPHAPASPGKPGED